jgi:hypothetical protein
VCKGLPASPRLSESLATRVVDFRRPFWESSFSQKEYDGEPSITSLLYHARTYGCRTLAVEDISSTSEIEYENALLAAAYPRHRMDALKRVTFWTSCFREPQELDNQPPRSLLGYAILKSDFMAPRARKSAWHVYESMLRCPDRPASGMFIPKATTLDLSCASRLLSATGVLYCGQNGLNKSCSHTNLRTIATHALGRDVPFSQIDSLIDPTAARKLGAGVRLTDICRCLSSLGIGNSALDYTIDPDWHISVPATEIIYNSITNASGALVGFRVGEESRGVNHMLFLYGYTLAASSMEQAMEAAYFDARLAARPATITPWLSEYVGTDDNIGPYRSISRHFPPIAKPLMVVSTDPSKVSLDARVASMIGASILRTLSGSMFGERLLWMETPLRSISPETLLFRPVSLEGQEYLAQLSLATDWSRNRENKTTLRALNHTLGSRPVWVVEFSVPDCVRSFYKLGEVVLDAGKTLTSADKVQDHFLFARLPSIYIMKEGRSFRALPSSLQDHTPFLHLRNIGTLSMNRNFQYDVAFSFAGEDRKIVRRLADQLISKNVKVFFDERERAELWGKDLYQHLQKVYRDMARYCVILISEAYARKLWAKHELKQAQARAFEENEEYILPIRLDDTEMPAINRTIGYVDLRTTNLAEVTDLILQKLES